ncbi:MAG: hypothetical protein ACPIDZ_05560 [Candidatus Puniceispirillales bacterium]
MPWKGLLSSLILCHLNEGQYLPVRLAPLPRPAPLYGLQVEEKGRSFSGLANERDQKLIAVLDALNQTKMDQQD